MSEFRPWFNCAAVREKERAAGAPVFYLMDLLIANTKMLDE